MGVRVSGGYMFSNIPSLPLEPIKGSPPAQWDQIQPRNHRQLIRQSRDQEEEEVSAPSQLLEVDSNLRLSATMQSNKKNEDLRAGRVVDRKYLKETQNLLNKKKILTKQVCRSNQSFS